LQCNIGLLSIDFEIAKNIDFKNGNTL
jgi:hypothetical protein